MVEICKNFQLFVVINVYGYGERRQFCGNTFVYFRSSSKWKIRYNKLPRIDDCIFYLLNYVIKRKCVYTMRNFSIRRNCQSLRQLYKIFGLCISSECDCSKIRSTNISPFWNNFCIYRYKIFGERVFDLSWKVFGMAKCESNKSD